jgi:Cdc6-like AAA superfamily ATPase
MEVVEELEKLLADVPALHNQLILLIGPPGSGKTAALLGLAKKLGGSSSGVMLLNVGSALGARLATVPGKARSLEAAHLLREMDEHSRNSVLLLDNIELLFDHHLRLDPLDLLKRQAQSRPVVAAWPGALHDGRLTYAHMGHPEIQDYAASGLVHLQIDA